MKYFVFAFTFFIFCVSVNAQIQTAITSDGKVVLLKPNKTWDWKDASTANSNLSLDLEAALIFRSGEVVPIARTTFYLLKRDIKDELTTGEAREILIGEASKLIRGMNKQYESGKLRDYLIATTYSPIYPNFTAKASQIIKDSTVAAETTDFKGLAKFQNLESGNYYLLGLANIRKNSVVWYIPVNLTESTKIVLDPNNAL